jgi:hypothetical protein
MQQDMHLFLKNEFPHLKMLSVKVYSFEKLTHFTMENFVEDTPTSQFDCVLAGHTCVFFFGPYRPFYYKVNDCPTWKCWQVEVLFWNSKLVPYGK